MSPRVPVPSGDVPSPCPGTRSSRWVPPCSEPGGLLGTFGGFVPERKPAEGTGGRRGEPKARCGKAGGGRGPAGPPWPCLVHREPLRLRPPRNPRWELEGEGLTGAHTCCQTGAEICRVLCQHRRGAVYGLPTGNIPIDSKPFPPPRTVALLHGNFFFPGFVCSPAQEHNTTARAPGTSVCSPCSCSSPALPAASH